MQIGIDLDNTIANYSKSFLNISKRLNYLPYNWIGNKNEIKKQVSSKENGIEIWKKLQGQVYGPFMKNAEIYEGFKSFLYRARRKKHDLYIISHKTKFGHYDQTLTPLRDVALEWLLENNIVGNKKHEIPIENVFFLSERKEKIAKIESLSLDYFIDDLYELLLGINNPKTKKILFQTTNISNPNDLIHFNSWHAISNYIYGKFCNDEIKEIFNKLADDDIVNLFEIKKGINSKVFKINGKINSYALKIYPIPANNEISRIKAELGAYKALKGFEEMVDIIGYDLDHNVALFNWADGEKIKKINNYHLDLCIKFIKKMNNIDHNLSKNLPKAKESCLSAYDIINQINKRLDQFNNIKNININNFLENIFKPNYLRAIEIANTYWPHNNLNAKISKKYLILSPSDFGFHNSIFVTNKKFIFIDFEYFGWDDPSKLINDFIWHPAMKMTIKQKFYWLKETKSVFEYDKTLFSRIKATWPLYGFRWIMIILKDALKYNEALANNNNIEIKKIENLFQNKLIKSQRIIKEINKNNFICPYV